MPYSPDPEEDERRRLADEEELERLGLRGESTLELEDSAPETHEQQLPDTQERDPIASDAAALDLEVESREEPPFDGYVSEREEREQLQAAGEEERARIDELRAEDERRLADILAEQERNHAAILENQALAQEGILLEQEQRAQQLTETLERSRPEREDAADRELDVNDAGEREEEARKDRFEEEGRKLKIEAQDIEKKMCAVEDGELARSRASAERDLADYEFGSGRTVDAFRQAQSQMFDREAQALAAHQTQRAQGVEHAIDTAVEAQDMTRARMAVTGEQRALDLATQERDARDDTQREALERQQQQLLKHEIDKAWVGEKDLRDKEDAMLRGVQDQAAIAVMRRYADEPFKAAEMAGKLQQRFDQQWKDQQEWQHNRWEQEQRQIAEQRQTLEMLQSAREEQQRTWDQQQRQSHGHDSYTLS